MGLLVVGSIALDSVQTPFGSNADALGGSAVYFSHAASILHPVQIVGVVGDDYPEEALARLAAQGVDTGGVERAAGESFRWRGKYSYDLQNRETLETELQLNVLDQIHRPTLVACDTMNYWIQSKHEALLALLRRIDVILVNDAEARELSGDWNVYRAARWILKAGPRIVVIKQGEFGAVLYERDRVFYIPAFPLEEVFDPTGAGDSFAGGFMGHLARSDDVSPENLRRAMVYGSAMGSFAVERFSVERFGEIGPAEVTSRVREFAELVRFDIKPEHEYVPS
jgi:sugar/nucleoside kinase (ribokinase family)